MMKKGVTRAEAQSEMDLVLGLLKRLRDLRIESVKDGDAMALKVRLRTVKGGKPGATTEKKAVKL
jgi:hypothetical protein